MTKRVGGVFGWTVLLACMVVVVGCDLDGSGGTTAEVDAAIERARAEEAAKANSSSSGGSRSSTASQPSARSSGGSSGGFVWKPISESDGRLAVLLPSSFAGRVSGVTIRRGGASLESGRFTGNTNGNRPTFRFSKPGAGYGTGLTLVATLRGGGSASWSIPNGGRRVG